MNMLSKLSKLQLAVVATVVLVIFIGGATILATSRKDEPTQVQTSSPSVASNSADLLKSQLNLYYASEREYPNDLEQLRNYLKTNPEVNMELHDRAVKELSDLDYSVRGDHEAYKFTYRDGSETKTVEANYLKDYK